MDWGKSAKAFINHVKHELKSAKGADKTVLKKMLQNLETVSGYPTLMGRVVGMKENKSSKLKDLIKEASPLSQWADDKKTNIAGQTKPFQPGDMWSEDFDYIGMLKFGAQLQWPETGFDNEYVNSSILLNWVAMCSRSD